VTPRHRNKLLTAWEAITAARDAHPHGVLGDARSAPAEVSYREENFLLDLAFSSYRFLFSPI